MVDIYLIRHGHVDYTPPNQVTAHNPLTPLGREMARRLAQRCDEYDLDLLVASPMLRAQETAAAIRERHPELPFLLMPEFAEISIADLEGYPGSLPPEDVNAWDEAHYRHARDVLWERARRGWSQLQETIAERRVERVALVSHGGPLNAIVYHVLGLEGPPRLILGVKMDYTATSCVRYLDGRQSIVWLNDARHVEDLAPVRQGLW